MDKQDQRDIQDQRGAKVIKGIVGMMVMLETQVKRGKKVRMITLCANDFRKSPFYWFWPLSFFFISLFQLLTPWLPIYISTKTSLWYFTICLHLSNVDLFQVTKESQEKRLASFYWYFATSNLWKISAAKYAANKAIPRTSWKSHRVKLSSLDRWHFEKTLWAKTRGKRSS